MYPTTPPQHTHRKEWLQNGSHPAHKTDVWVGGDVEVRPHFYLISLAATKKKEPNICDI